jgi:hypothetical protein
VHAVKAGRFLGVSGQDSLAKTGAFREVRSRVVRIRRNQQTPAPDPVQRHQELHGHLSALPDFERRYRLCVSTGVSYARRPGRLLVLRHEPTLADDSIHTLLYVLQCVRKSPSTESANRRIIIDSVEQYGSVE